MEFEAGISPCDTPTLRSSAAVLPARRRLRCSAAPAFPSILIDPHKVYPFDFRVEKISGHEQVERFCQDGNRRSRCCARQPMTARTGSRDSAICSTRQPSRQYGIIYDTLDQRDAGRNRRAGRTVCAKVVGVKTSAERQKLTLSDGEPISARLIVLANGLNVGLRRTARHRASGHQRLPFDHDRLRCGAGRPNDLRFSGADLFLGTAERPHPLHHAVSDRRRGCAPICSSIARSTIPGCAQMRRARRPRR